MKRILALSVLAATFAGGTAYLMTSSAPSSTGLTALGAAVAQEAEAIEIEDMALGQADAPVTVIEYASFTCPHCAAFHDTVFGKIKENYIDTGKVRFVLRDVYFDRYGLWAGMLARCGGEMRYFGIADMIYEQQRKWTQGEPVEIAENLKKIGKTAGLTQEQVDACLQDADMAQALVSWYQENAKEDGIEATPSFIINGKKYSNMSYDDFAEVLDSKIAE